MATQKRHVVYLSDEEWGKAVAQAKAFDMTASAYIRSLIVGGRLVPIDWPDYVRDDPNRPMNFIRPFTPKPTRRK